MTIEQGAEKLVPGTIFKEGDLLAGTVRSNEDAHLRIFAKTPSGKLVTLFPNVNSTKTGTLIKANTPVQVPDVAAEFELITEGPEFGEKTLIAVVSNSTLVNLGLWAGSPRGQRTGSPLAALARSQCHGKIAKVEVRSSGFGEKYANSPDTAPEGELEKDRVVRVVKLK